VNPKLSFTLSIGLRSILRHDPDIIMVGEVRDPETAEIAIKTALTGHSTFKKLKMIVSWRFLHMHRWKRGNT